jgi:hypothetical protein
MAFCSQCGNKLVENAVFCSGCGTKLEAAAPFQEAVTAEPLPAGGIDSGVTSPEPVQEAAQIPEWLNQPEEPALEAPPPPPFFPAPPPPPAAEQTHQAYIMPQAGAKGKSPLAVAAVVLLGLALFAGGFFGVHLLLPVVF